MEPCDSALTIADVNQLTKPDQYPIPRLDDSLDMLGNSTMYSTMDACSAYWQIRMDPDSVEKTTFISHAGLYAFKFMPFGLRNAPATMGRAMQKILCRENRKTCIVYLDDCIVFSKSFEKHLTRLDTILQRMTEYDLKLKPSKCFFAQEDVSFLGHLVSARGIQPDPERIKPLLNYPIPRDKTGVRAFLGMTGFYRRFIRFYSKIAQPLYALLKKDSDFEWSPSCQEAFNALRNHLLEAPVLAHYDPNAIYILRTDAARVGLGGHLIQCPVIRDDQGNVTKILRKEARLFACCSRTTTKEERNYGVTNLECLAIIFSIDKFRPYLFGPKFIIESDHCALCILTKGEKPIDKNLPVVSPYSGLRIRSSLLLRQDAQ